MKTQRPGPPLDRLRVLLTRPAGQAAEWRRDLEALGAAVRNVPVLAIEPVPEDTQTQAVIKNLDQFDFAIFVSTNAVQHAHDRLVARGQAIPAELTCYAVGDKTTRAAAAAGFRARATAAVDSESLLALPELQLLRGKSVVVFKGAGGRELISQTLRARGAKLVEALLYQRCYPAANAAKLRQALLQSRPHVICVTSEAGVHNLIRMACAANVLAQLHATAVLAPGARVARAAQSEGFVDILTARTIRFSDVSYALRDWWRAAPTRSCE